MSEMTEQSTTAPSGLNRILRDILASEEMTRLTASGDWWWSVVAMKNIGPRGGGAGVAADVATNDATDGSKDWTTDRIANMTDDNASGGGASGGWRRLETDIEKRIKAIMLKASDMPHLKAINISRGSDSDLNQVRCVYLNQSKAWENYEIDEYGQPRRLSVGIAIRKDDSSSGHATIRAVAALSGIRDATVRAEGVKMLAHFWGTRTGDACPDEEAEILRTLSDIDRAIAEDDLVAAKGRPFAVSWERRPPESRPCGQYP